MRPDYGYVDFHVESPEFRSQWERVHTSKIEGRIKPLVEKCGLFHTVQRYRDPIHSQGEPALAPVYFDLDSEASVEKAAADAALICGYFTSHLQIPEPLIRVWFSGKKGFHITIDPDVFGIEPHPDIEDIIERAAAHVSERLKVTTFDKRVYSKRRQWRIPGTRHLGTGLYCTEIYHRELSDLAAVRKVATSPRAPLYPVEELICQAPMDLAVDWWRGFVYAYKAIVDLVQHSPTKPISVPKDKVTAETPRPLPVCMMDLLTKGLKKPKTRHYALLSMACFLKDAGWPYEEALAKLLTWTQQEINAGRSATPLPDAIADLNATLKDVYDDAKDRHFRCSFQRSLGVSWTGTGSVACEAELCRFANEQDQMPKNPVKLALPDALNAAYVGDEVAFEAKVIDGREAPFVVPVEGIVTCTPELESEKSICHRCRLVDKEGNAAIRITARKDPGLVLGMCDTDDQKKHAAFKRRVGIPAKCDRHTFRPTKEMNVIAAIVAPHIDHKAVGQNKAMSHVHAEVFILSEDPALDVNRVYLIRGFPWPHPESQRVTIVADSFHPVNSVIDNFVLTAEQIQRLKVFQPTGTQAVEDKFNEIWADIECNATHVWDRRYVGFGLDMAFHSCLNYRFQGQEERGWIQMLLLGDTDQAKTSLIERLMAYYDLGTYVSCESASKAGISHGAQKSASGKWVVDFGVFSSNDRSLVAFDEFNLLDPSDVEDLGTVRDKGIINVNMIVKGQALGRCRGIYSANPKLQIGKYDRGIKAVMALFKLEKDVRRYDFAVIMAKGEVALEKINQMLTASSVDSRFPPMDCKNLLLWAWSRTPEQILISAATADACLKAATRLSKTYYCDIPLCQDGSMRKKVMRLAIATAMRTFSTEDGIKCIVKPEHVQFVEDYLTYIYNRASMAYGSYAKWWQKKELMSEEKKADVMRLFWGKRDVLEWIFDNDYVTMRGLCDSNNMDMTDGRAMVAQLSRLHLLDHKAAYYVKTPAFNNVINDLLADPQYGKEEAPPGLDNGSKPREWTA